MSVVISQNLVLSAEIQPLTHARIGYQKISGTITASSTADGYDAEYPDNELTYNFWKPDSMPATWEVDAGTASDCNYIGIAAHTLGTDSVTVTAQYYDGDLSSWVDIDSTLPGDDSPIMFLFDSVSWTKYRLSFSGSTAPRIGVVYMGVTLDMQRGIYGGHSPLTLSRQTTIRPTMSESGQFLGRSIIATGCKTSWAWSNLGPFWYRENFDPFVEHCRTKPFFIAWRPSKFPNEVGYCWTSSDITPTNNGNAGYMDVSVTATGLGYE
jgi:hypothetical protein